MDERRRGKFHVSRHMIIRKTLKIESWNLKLFGDNPKGKKSMFCTNVGRLPELNSCGPVSYYIVPGILGEKCKISHWKTDYSTYVGSKSYNEPVFLEVISWPGDWQGITGMLVFYLREKFHFHEYRISQIGLHFFFTMCSLQKKILAKKREIQITVVKWWSLVTFLAYKFYSLALFI